MPSKTSRRSREPLYVQRIFGTGGGRVSLRIVHKNGGVKTADEVINFIEEFNNTRLLPYQKLFVKAVYNHKTFVVMPVHLGYTQLINIINRCKKWG